MKAKLLEKLRALFPEEQWVAVTAMLETECGSELPFADTLGTEGIERVRCAVLKICDGSIDKLKNAILAANFDWRDVLVAADFANSPEEYSDWLNDGA
jgi:hypothetical protein